MMNKSFQKRKEEGALRTVRTQKIMKIKRIFIVVPETNKQNDRVVNLSEDFSMIPKISITEHPASAMKLGVVASNGEKMPSVWFPIGY